MLPASRAYKDWQGLSNENVFIQGMIDVVVRDDSGSLIIVDYKTDRIRTRGDMTDKATIKDHFREMYRFQIDMYIEALESSWNETVQAAYLYLFDAGLTVDMRKKVE